MKRPAFPSTASTMVQRPRRSERAEIRAAARKDLVHTQGAQVGTAWRLVRGGLRMARIEPTGLPACRLTAGDVVTLELDDVAIFEVLAEVQGAVKAWPYLTAWTVRSVRIDRLAFPEPSPDRRHRATNQRQHLEVRAAPSPQLGKFGTFAKNWP